MTNKIVAIILIATFIVPASAISLLAQDVKIGYIDSIKIFAEYSETQEAERLYRQEVDQWTAQKQRMEQEIVKLRDELQAQSLMLSEEKKAEKKLELDRKMAEYEQFMAETFGDDGLAAKRNKELTQPIVEKINKILEDLGKEQGYTMIFDVANANVVYADKTLDLTEMVLEKLNQLQ
ncbi:MAG: OmpH family outer membrane protein [Candidatus Latescibacterota bacterium]|jgi:outer membrane protein